MSGIGNNNQYSNVRAINRSDGSAFLLSDRLASLNFNGFIPRTNSGIYASDLKVGQTIFSSDPTAQNNTFFITRIDSSPVTVEDVSENSYFLYFLGDSNIEEAYTYGAENENGSFSQNHLFNSYRDDTSGLSIGTDGWMITNQGNAVFSNVFVRGTVEATSGKIDGILSIGEDLSGTPLVTIGKNLFESASFEGSSSEHSGIFLNKDNYFMGYEDLQTVPILSVVAEDSTRNVTLRKAVFTLANHTLSVRDEVSIFGFTEDKFLELDNVFQVEEVTQNSFTVYYKNEIPGTTSPISVNLKVESFALDNIYTVTELNLVNVVSTENTSALKIYIEKQYTGNFEQDFTINIGSATNEIFLQNTRHLVESIVETAGPDDPDYLTATCLRVPAGTYTTGLGQINSFLTNHKFKVGNETNSMSYNSFTGALTVTGKINADSGNFTNTVTIGKNNTSYSVYNKKLLGGVATLTTEAIHNFVIGDTVIVSGVDNTFNGTYVVTGVPTLESFTYDKVSDPVASTPVSPLGTAAIGEAENGTLSVGYGTNKITIDGTGTASTSAIYAGVGNYGNPDTGFFMDASGRFSLKDKLTFTSAGDLTVSGTINASAGNFTGFVTAGNMKIGKDVESTNDGVYINSTNYWYDDGKFSLGSGTKKIYFDGTDVVITSAVVIEGGLTADSLTIGTSPTILKIDENVKDDNDGIYINDYNYWYTDGRFAAGGAASGIVWNNTNFTVTGKINATSGYIGSSSNGWNINSSSIVSNGNSSIVVGGGTSTIQLNATGLNTTTYIGISSGTPTYSNPNTPFYADAAGRFSIGNRIVWDPSGTGVLTIDGVLRGYVNDTTPITANPGNTMGFGLFSTGATGVGLKINDNNYWFADINNPRIRVGSSLNYLSYESSLDVLEVTGRINAESGTIGTTSPWRIIGGKISSGSQESFIGLQTTSSGTESQIYTLNLDSIVIDNEGGGLSSIYMVVDDAPTTLLGQEDLITLKIPVGSIILSLNPDETKLTDYVWTVRDTSLDQYSIVSGSADITGSLPPGKITLVIYGEDYNETFVDESIIFTGSETVTITTLSSENTGIWIGNELFNNAPFSVDSQGLMKASSGSIGGFNFASSDEGGSFTSKDLGIFDKGIYEPPYSIELSPTEGIILNANKSLNDAAAYLIEETEIAFPNSELEYRNILRSTGFTIVDNTGSASNVTINPYMGIRSESVSALNIAKNGSFEYKAGSSTSYSYSGAGWTAGSGLTLSSLSATTSGYSFPALPYGQQFVGNLSWTTASSEFLTTQFLLDPGGFYENYLSPADSTTYLAVGANAFSTSFAIYNSKSDGLFGTDHYVAAYPIQDLKITYTDNDGITQTINPLDNTYIQISDMLQNLIDNSTSDAVFEDGYLYLSAPYTENILSFPITTNTRQSFSITSKTGDLLGEDTGVATLTIGAHSFTANDEVSLFAGTTDISGSGEDAYTYTVLSVASTTITIDTQYDDISSANSVKTSIYTLTIGSHPFYAGKEVGIFNGSTDLGEEMTFSVLSVTSTQIVVDSDGILLSTANTVKTDGSPVYSSLSTRGKNGIEFEIDSSQYSDANFNLPFTLHFPGYYYGLTFSTIISRTATFSRAQSSTLALTVDSGADVVFESPDSYELFYATTTGLSNSATTLTFTDLSETGIYDLHKDYSNASETIDSYSTSATSIIVSGNQTLYHPVNSFAYIEDPENPSEREYIKVTARAYDSDFDETTLTVLRAQLGSAARPIDIFYYIYAIERVNVTNVVNNTATYYNFDKALFDSVNEEVIPIIGNKINNSSVAFDELVISDSAIPYFDGDTGGGAVWGADASQPATWSYRPSAVIAQLGGNPLVIGNTPGLQLIKQISYEPYTYLLENPSVTVQQWDTDPSQSSLVISGGKFSIGAKEPRIELVSGTSAANNGMVNLDGSKIRLMDSHPGTTGLVVAPWTGTSSIYLSLSPNTYSGSGYGLLFSNNTTFLSSNTGGSTIIRGPNNTTTAEITLSTAAVSISNLVTSDTSTATYGSNSNIVIPAGTNSFATTVSGVGVSGVVFKAPRSGAVMVHMSATVGVYDGESYCVTEVRTGNSVTGTGGTIVASASEGTGIYVNGANSTNLATCTGATFYRLTGLTPGTNYQVYFRYLNNDSLSITIYNRKIMVVPEL